MAILAKNFTTYYHDQLRKSELHARYMKKSKSGCKLSSNKIENNV